MCPGSHCRAVSGDCGAAVERHRDSHESPGPTTEATLSCPSTRRVLTVGALALAVIAPAVETAERPADASAPPPSIAPAVAQPPGFEALVRFTRPAVDQRISRSALRRLA